MWNRDVDENHIFYSIKDDKNWQLRIDWFSFASYLAFYFQTKGYKADIEYKPMYEIKQKRYLAYSHVFYPHMNNKIKFLPRRNQFFYMQMNIPGLFTIDKNGWGGMNSLCHKKNNLVKKIDFDSLLESIQKNKYKTKFKQLDRYDLDSEFDIFFPLQIPYDQNIKINSRYDQFQIFNKLVVWAKNKNLKIIFKTHPQNDKLFDRYLKMKDDKNIFFSDESIYSLFKSSNLVYTINSSVGFEAILHNKKVVTFGKCDYAAGTIIADINNLDFTYSEALMLSNVPLSENKFLKEYFSKSIYLDVDKFNHDKFDNIFKILKD